MFSRFKSSKAVSSNETEDIQVNEKPQDRDSVLSGWGAPAESFTDKGFSQEQTSSVTGSIKKGYKICMKCLSVVPATDSRCPSCGFIKK